jgi:hypothetical protein
MGVLILSVIIVGSCIAMWGIAIRHLATSQIIPIIFGGMIIVALVVLCSLMFLMPAINKYPVISDVITPLSESDFTTESQYLVKENGEITIQTHHVLRSFIKYDHVYFTNEPPHLRTIVRHLPASFFFFSETDITTDLYLPDIYRNKE